ncbi:dihydrodipicolinate synthase [Pelagirhabdus alkalitolerans]|uniref:4-hydroxy-tetrahydrodipicolinate synthase n=1 Tax=Pelagirhabdus alkalitolerans TaxID=1612202 RepID=A0A1G6H7E2_9BACI|nr:4-hydroxy-tetrahydrodipicolinate synthase [Pelagirhabdus alkalitolerans]SDB90182.1 dihydrodipicolinate synthase [Pelagirhabdus alkalitolerans]
MDFGRLLTAMVTPFDQHGEVDYQQTKHLIDHLIAHKTETLVVNGTTGESPTLTSEEKSKFIQFVVEYVNGRIPVIAGTGSNNTLESIQLTKESTAIGVDGVMVVTPYYNKPNQEGMYQHFKAIAASTHLPVMLYNIPGRSVVRLDVDTIIRLSQIENITSIKDATGDLEAVSTINERTKDDFKVYSGDDPMTLPILSVGGYGVVSVTSHIAGEAMHQLIDDYVNGHARDAIKTERELSSLMKALFIAPNPVPVKQALNLLGYTVGSVRLPLVPLNDVEFNIVKEAVDVYLENRKIS